MDRKSKLLPTLQGSKSKSRLTKDKLKIEQIIFKNANNRKSHKDYRSDQDFTIIKANNFISRVETIDSPQIIFAITDQIKQAISSAKEKENLNESCQINKSTLSAFRNSNGFLSPKNTFHKRNSGFKAENRLIAQERQSALELARWLDEKISKLRVKHTITFLDILQYKQNILNYALGKIIDSLSRRCKQQGQILSLIWQNTFNMFQSVFNVLVDANKTREKENLAQSKELHQIFQTNHNFLREENIAFKKENEQIFQKMKNVIIWNKRLRRERKHLNTANRILQYRNTTYSQALQETLEMLLQSTPDPTLLQTAKKTILKLGKEKNRKKHYIKQQIDSELNATTRNIVYNWLKKNSYLDQQKLELFKESCFSKQDGFIFSQLDDLNEINQVNIYDFFKLYDVGVQAVPLTSTNYSQCQKKTFRNVEMMTRNISTMEYGCQTNPTRKDSQLSNESPSAKKHVEISSNKPSSIFKYKKQKSKTPVKGKQTKNISQKQKDRQGINTSERGIKDLHRDFRKQSINDHYFKQKLDSNLLYDKRDEAISQNKISINKIEEQRLLYEKGDNSSMSLLIQEDTRTKGIATTKNMITYSQKGRQKSLADFNEPHNNGSSKMIKLAQIQGFKRKQNQKRSVAYIKYDSPKTLQRLVHKTFTEAYKDQKQIFENNKEQFVDQIIRRRSFYTKRRVQFANFRQAEQQSQKLRQYMRGTRYFANNRNRVVDKANLLNYTVDRWTKKGTAPSNIAKSKALTSAKGVFESITSSIQQIVRIPPKNKAFVNNSLSTLAKYISDLVVDYIRQIKREKQELSTQGEKALYPLSVLLMERMTFKYGLKEIAQKKIKHFIQKVLTFSSISQKISLYSLLLGLDDRNVGTDQLLAYLKCLVYFQEKKPGRDTSTESNLANIELVREHIRKILQYFFDSQYINLVELKLQIYFQQSSSYATVEGIALIIIHQLLRRKKQLRLKYSKIYTICNRGANFFTNVFQLLRMASNYRDLAINSEVKKSIKKEKQTIDTLKQIRTRAAVKKHEKNEHKILSREYDICKISEALHQLLKRSDIMDEQYGKSITQQRFITAAMLLNLPNVQDLDTLLRFMREQFEIIKSETNYFNSISCDDFKSLDKLAKVWNKSNIQGEGEPIWQFSKIYAQKVEQEVFGVMGKLGIIGTAIETFLFNFESV